MSSWNTQYLLTCDYAVRLDRYLFHILMLIYHFSASLLVVHGSLFPLDDQS